MLLIELSHNVKSLRGHDCVRMLNDINRLISKDNSFFKHSF